MSLTQHPIYNWCINEQMQRQRGLADLIRQWIGVEWSGCFNKSISSVWCGTLADPSVVNFGARTSNIVMRVRQ